MAGARETIYLETTVVSVYASRPARDPVQVERQKLTRRFWLLDMPRYDVFVSEMVEAEAAEGDGQAAKRRLSLLEQFAILPQTDAVESLAESYLTKGIIPAKAKADAYHIAYASVYRLDYLVTWNMRHLVNANAIKRLGIFNRSLSMHVPLICVPESLYGPVPEEE